MRSPHGATTKNRSLRPRRHGLALLAAIVAAVLGGAPASAASADYRAAASTGWAHDVLVHGRTAKPRMLGHFGIVPTVPTGRARAVPRTASGVLHYGGGPVQHDPAVYLVFWGSQWNSDTNGVMAYMEHLFNGLGTSQDSWSRVTSQYTDSSGQGPSFNGPVLQGTWVDASGAAPSSASAAQIAAEANAGAQHFGVSGSNVQMWVLSPSGTSPDGFPNTGFCAWHDYNGNVPYINMPYVLDAGPSCGANAVGGWLDGFSIVAGHEYAETITDPEPTSGWVSSDGEENGDLCAWQGLGTISLPTGTFAMQPTWSNAVNGCVMSG